VFLASLVLAATAAGSVPAPAEISSALSDVLDDSYQTQLPEMAVPDSTHLGGMKLRPPLIIIPPEVMRVLWIVAIALVVMWLVQAFVLPALPGARDEELTPYDFDREAVPADLPLPDHRELARDGRFAEAVHVMFLRALLTTARRLRVPLPAALTSREVLRRWRLDDRQRDDLGSLAVMVERSHFGGREVNADDYEACLPRYARLAETQGPAR